MANEYGQKLNSYTSLDSALSVSAGSTANGTAKDIGANTSPQAVSVECEFALTQTGTTNSADLEVKVQFSDDNSTWPDTGEGDPIFTWKAGSVGADLTRSNAVSFRPKARYFRFQYKNNNGTDSFTVDSAVGLTTLQDNAA